MSKTTNMPEYPDYQQSPETELQEVNADIKWSLSFAIGSVALAGASAYATYAVATGKDPSLEPLAVGSGGFLLGAGTALKLIPQTVSLARRRKTLKEEL